MRKLYCSNDYKNSTKKNYNAKTSKLKNMGTG